MIKTVIFKAFHRKWVLSFGSAILMVLMLSPLMTSSSLQFVFSPTVSPVLYKGIQKDVLSQQPSPLFEDIEIVVKDSGIIESNYRLFRSNIYIPAFNATSLSTNAKKALLLAEFSIARGGTGPFLSPGMLSIVFNVSDEATARTYADEFLSSVVGIDPTTTAAPFVTRLSTLPSFFGYTLPPGGALVFFYSLETINVLHHFSVIQESLEKYSSGIGKELAAQFDRVDKVSYLLLRYGESIDEIVQGVGVHFISHADKLTGTHYLSVKELFQLPSQITVDTDYLNITIILPRIDPSTLNINPTPLIQEQIPPQDRLMFLDESSDDRFYRVFFSLTQTTPDVTVQYDYSFHPKYRDDWAEVGIFASPVGKATRRLLVRGENATLSTALFNELQTNSEYDVVSAITITNLYVNNTTPDGQRKLSFLSIYPYFYFFTVEVNLFSENDNITVVNDLAQLINQTLFNGNQSLNVKFIGDYILDLDNRKIPVKRYQISTEFGGIGLDEDFNLTKMLVNSTAWNMTELLRTSSYNYKEKGYYTLSNSFYQIKGAFTNESYWGAELAITWPVVDVFNGPSSYDIWPIGQTTNQLIPEDIFGFNDLNLTNSELRGLTLNILVPVEKEDDSALNVPLGFHNNYTAIKGFFASPRSDTPLATQLGRYYLFLYQSVFDVAYEWYWINVFSKQPQYYDDQNNLVSVNQFIINFNYTMRTPGTDIQLPLPVTIGFIDDDSMAQTIPTSTHVGLNPYRNDSNIVYFGEFDYQYKKFNGIENLLFLIQDDYGVYLNGTAVAYQSDLFGLVNNTIWNHWITSVGISEITVTFMFEGVPPVGGNFESSGYTNDHFSYNGTDVIFWNYAYQWNGTAWDSLDSPPPFVAHALNFTWDTTKFADGTWKVIINATNNNGKWATRSFKLVVDNYADGTSSKPQVNILPTSDIQPDAIIRTQQPTLRFNLTDDIGIFGAYLTIDNKSYWLDPNANEFVWDTSTTWEGQHVISLTAIDREGQNTTLTFTVHVDKGADPTVEVISPKNNTVLGQGESVSVIIRATDDRGIDKVLLSINGGIPEQLSTVDGENYTQVIEADVLGNGTHQLLISVRDKDLYPHEVNVLLIVIVNISVSTTSTTPTTQQPTTSTQTSTQAPQPAATPSFTSLPTLIGIVGFSTALLILRRKRLQKEKIKDV